jgi:sigma-B regulation protein RsbU (phosphoserine phosphatase)
MDVQSRNNVVVTGRPDGPVVMLAHGFGCDQNMWRLMVPALTEEYRVVLFDYVGSERSALSPWNPERYASLEGYAQDVLEICRELDLREVVFVGHSVSAMAGVLACVAEPERFAKLVMIGPSSRYTVEGDYTNYLGWSAAMAPVIMGNPERPEPGQELTNSFCATDPGLRPHHVPLRQPGRSGQGPGADPGPGMLTGRHRPSRGGCLRSGVHSRQPSGDPGGDRALPAAERSGSSQPGAPVLPQRSPVMCTTGPDPESPGPSDEVSLEASFSALLEDDVNDLYENAPCGYLSTLLDGKIAKANTTLLTWLGYGRDEMVGRMRFTDLLTVGGKLYHETHFAPLLRMQGTINGIALELKASDGARLPVLVTSTVKTGTDGEPLLIRTTLVDARDRRAYEQELLRARREAEAARERAERDRARLQSVLATLQQSLLPPSLPVVPGLEAAAHYHTASPDQLGGDFYDLFALGDGRWGFFLGDVCGKGPEAAAVTSLTRYTLRATALHDANPVAVLESPNTALHQRYTSGDARYCTVIFGTLTPNGDQFDVTLASGGHPPALVLRADGTADYLHTPGGFLIGVLPDAPFTAATTTLEPGDTLLLYTDGLTEARHGTAGERYGDDALHDFAAGLAPATAGAANTAVTELLHSFGEGLDDDTAVLCLGIPPVTSSEESS